MQRILVGILTMACISATAGDAPPAAGGGAQTVRVKFVPDKAGEKGAYGTHLGQPPGAMIHIGVGDKFTVKDKNDRAVFTMSMPEGNDDHVVLEIKAKDLTQKLDIKRDKSDSVSVQGAKYSILYPSVSVNAPGKDTSNQAFIVVSELPEK